MDYRTIHRQRVEHAGEYHRDHFGAWGDEPKRVQPTPRRTGNDLADRYEAYKAPLADRHAERIKDEMGKIGVASKTTGTLPPPVAPRVLAALVEADRPLKLAEIIARVGCSEMSARKAVYKLIGSGKVLRVGYTYVAAPCEAPGLAG